MTTFFDITNNLMQSREYIFDAEVEAAYLPFLVNRSISSHYDCVMFASEMNTRPDLTKKQQYDFYHYGIKVKKRRYAKWAKPEKDERIEVISKFYQCSYNLAEQYSPLITDDQLLAIKQKMSTGGRNG